MILDFIFDLLWLILGLFMGGYILLFGRRAVWATLGVIGLIATANLLAVFVAGADSFRELLDVRAWGPLAAAVAVGLLGVYLGRQKVKLAVGVIGILVGADLALWFYDISYHLVTVQARWPEETAVLVGLLIVLIGALIGFWFVRQYRDDALVLASVALGTEIVYLTLGLNENSSFTAVLVLSVALAGVVVQYADYLRELKRAETLGTADTLLS